MKKDLNRKLLIIFLVAVLAISLLAVVACDYIQTPNSPEQPDEPKGEPNDEPKVERLTATFDTTHVVYDSDNLDSLKPYFTVTYTDENGSTQVTEFLLIGSLQVGSTKIAVNYQDLTVIVTINVLKSNTQDPAEQPDDPKIERLTANFDADRIVYEGDELDSLKPYFTVTYIDGNGEASQVTDYTLIGGLKVGDNTVVVLYQNLASVVTLNAIKKPTVTFVADGVIVAVKTYTIYNLTVTKPALPDKLGYDGVWEEYTISVDSGDVTVNAIYTAKSYTVYFDYTGADGAISQPSMTVTYGKPIAIMPKPTSMDNDFIGWYFNSTLIETGDIWLRPYNCTLVAKWTPAVYDSYGLSYYLNNDNESYSVRGYSDTLNGELTIPETHLGKPVTEIVSSTFENCSILTSVVIPDSVTKIGGRAFYGCEQLVIVELGNNVKTIGNYAFVGCAKLKEITIPASVTSITADIVSKCPSLESITVEQGNERYVSRSNCLIDTTRGILINGCKNSVIPTDGSVKSIGGNAFDGCCDLSEILIPNSVATIGSYAFRDCVKLKSIVIPDSVGSGLIHTFSGCTALESVTLSNNLVGISYAFKDCISLKTITIPSSVRFITTHSFAGCSNLESVTILNREVRLIVISNAFIDCEKLSSIYFEGTQEDWNSNMDVRTGSGIENVTVYFYSEGTPALNGDGTDYDGNYWHWEADLPSKWEFKD